MLSRRFIESQAAWNCLNGVINVYKPPGVSVSRVKNAILSNLCKDLNKLEVREPSESVLIEPTENDGNQKFLVEKTASLSDHILSTGPRHQMQDFRCNVAASLGFHTSGVLLLGINDSTRHNMKIQANRPIRVYHVTGRFGTATENHLPDSRITIKAKYYHVWGERFSSMVSSLQASHQRKMFEMCGVDLESQAGYELASKGLIRPVDNKIPIIYGIKLIHFNKPEFGLEIHAINENEGYLATLVHEMAIELRSVAHCTGIRCIRHGHFDVTESLLRRHWTLDGVLANMDVCKKIFLDHPTMLHRQNVELSPN